MLCYVLSWPISFNCFQASEKSLAVASKHLKPTAKAHEHDTDSADLGTN